MNDRDIKFLEAMFGTPIRNGIQSFPFHNLIKFDSDNLMLELAVAGYTKDQIEVSQDKNVLSIVGDNSDEDDGENIEYIHKGISSKKFRKEFTLGEYIEVNYVSLDNGILSIKLVRNIPEEKRPKTFEID